MNNYSEIVTMGGEDTANPNIYSVPHNSSHLHSFDRSVDLTNVDCLLKMHEETLSNHIKATRSLEEEREFNRRLINEI